MDRIKDFLRNAFSYPRLLLQSHPITAVSMITSTVLFAIHNVMQIARNRRGTDSGSVPFDIFFHICIAILFFAIFALCLESIKMRFKKKAVTYAVFALFGVLSLFLSFITADFTERTHITLFTYLAGIRTGVGPMTVIMRVGALLALALVVALYFSYINAVRQPFNVHFTDVNSKAFFISIIYSVIQVGVIFLTLIVMLLLYDDAFDYLFAILILINGLFYAPAVVCAVTRQNERANMFFSVLVRYVMLTITLLAYIIIYLYMIKLVVTASVPSNSVFGILTALFVISMYVTYMCTTYEETGFLQKFAYNSPIIFAPFILMQCYTIIVRIGQYGLTPMRYFGIAFIVFEIVYITYYVMVRKREHEIAGSGILVIICAFILITFFVPGINAISLSTASAKRTLATYLDTVKANGTVSGKMSVHANAAYGFLTDSNFGEGRIVKYFPGMDPDTVKELRENARAERAKDTDEDYDYYAPENTGWYSADITELAGGAVDLGGYNRLVHVSIRDDGGDRSDRDRLCDPATLSVYAYNVDNEQVFADMSKVDLSDFCKKFIDLSSDLDDDIISDNEFRRQCAQICVIDINENARLYITDADISGDAEHKPVYIGLEGYLLMK